MININFKLLTKSMTSVIEYMEKLKILEVTNKQSSTKKNDKDKLVDKTEKSKNKAKKERQMTWTLRMTVIISTVQSVMPKVGHYGLITLMTE